MPDSRWVEFLKAFNEELLADEDILDDLPPEVAGRGWLGTSGATAEELDAMQARLGVVLPLSYRTFLESSNGWATTGWEQIRLLPADEVKWLRDFDPDIIELWTSLEYLPVTDADYSVYGPNQDCVNVRTEYFQDMLVISDHGYNGDQVWLNPSIRTEDGEWEAWHFSSDYPGAARHRSFRELLEDEREGERRRRDG